MRLKQGDGTFIVLTIASIAYGVSQFVGLLKTTAGINISWLALWEGFMIFNFLLSLRAYKEAQEMEPGPDRDEKHRKSLQASVSYGLGGIMNGINTVYLALHLQTFDWVDKTNFAFVGIALVIVLARYYKSLTCPMALACYAILCKAVPQLFMAWRVGPMGVNPANFLAILAIGHLLIILRLMILFRSYRAKQEEATKGLIISEGANELSWLIVTASWLWF